MDKGTETGKTAAVPTYVMAKNDLFDDPMDSIVYGPSTMNKIERWWCDYHEKFEKLSRDCSTLIKRYQHSC